MIHALVLGLVIAIVLIILIQKVTSGFTAAECDARYTKDYRACGDAYEKAQRKCKGRNTESCKQKALRTKESCIDAAASVKITCLGPAAAAGDVVATSQLQAAQTQSVKTSSPPSVTAAALVTPGATFTPAGNQGGASASIQAPVPAPAPPPVLAVPAPAEAPSALQMAACPPGDTAMLFVGQQSGEALAGGSALSLRAGDQVCSKPAPGAYQCDFGAGYAYHGGAGIQECVKPRIA